MTSLELTYEPAEDSVDESAIMSTTVMDSIWAVVKHCDICISLVCTEFKSSFLLHNLHECIDFP
jgi:hypothetical protein